MPSFHPQTIDEWIIYLRISDDREGRGLGVERQENLCVDLHRDARLGGRIIAVCVDNDLTANDASARYKGRPGYDSLVELLAERPGRRGVITYHTDRLHRTPRELEDFIDLAERCDVPVRTVRSGPIDLSTPGGQMHARIACAVAKHESEQTAVRIRDKVDQLAESGAIGNGGPRPFGYHRVYEGEGRRRRIVRDELHPTEAPLVAEAARMILDGATTRSVVGWLNGQGVTTTAGNQWTDQALRAMLRSGRIAGLREHKRQVVGKAVWPAIIDQDSHDQLRALLKPKGTRNTGARVYRWWLTGFMYCANCLDLNEGRGVMMRTSRRQGKARFLCPSDGGCGCMSVEVPHVEALVGGYVVDRLSDPRVLAGIHARNTDTADEAAVLSKLIDDDQRRLDLLQTTLDDAPMEELAEVVSSVRKVRRRIAGNRERLAVLTQSPGLRLLGPGLADRWDGFDIDEKRQLLALVVARVVVRPATRRGRFDPGRIDIVRA